MRENRSPFDTAKLKNEGSLSAARKSLVGNAFGIAVVVIYSGMAGDAQKALVLTQVRVTEIRVYLVGNFGFDGPARLYCIAQSAAPRMPGRGGRSFRLRRHARS
jgi:hypothetical protein